MNGKKRLITLVLALLLIVQLLGGAALADVYTAVPIRFDDVSESDWFFEYVDYATNVLGLVDGKAEGKFCPYDNMTYAEAITLAVRINAIAYDRYSELDNLISGQPANAAWYQPYLDYARAHGIPWQYADYNAKSTRAEYVHIFYSALREYILSEIASGNEILLNRVDDGAIPDVPMSHKYAEDIYTFYRMGILDGSDDAHNFKPNDNIRRNEVAAVLCRLCDSYDLKEFTLTVSGSGSETSSTVYITDTGAKFHRAGCRYLSDSVAAISRDTAIALGYEPCSVCNP